MYCPCCGDTLTLSLGVYRCERGEMELSHMTAEALTECYIARKRTPHSRPRTRGLDRAWYCPGCGVKMREAKAVFTCPACRRSINEFIHELLDLHPHRDERGMWPWH